MILGQSSDQGVFSAWEPCIAFVCNNIFSAGCEKEMPSINNVVAPQHGEILLCSEFNRLNFGVGLHLKHNFCDNFAEFTYVLYSHKYYKYKKWSYYTLTCSLHIQIRDIKYLLYCLSSRVSWISPNIFTPRIETMWLSQQPNPLMNLLVWYKLGEKIVHFHRGRVEKHHLPLLSQALLINLKINK